MPLTQEEKEKIVNRVVTILQSPEKEQLITELKTSVLNSDSPDDGEYQMDDVVYSVIQAIEELYG